jgi:DNA-binding GntR family transcriptional regulator
MVKKVDPVDVSTLQHRVYQSLRLALLRGRFQPGEAVSIRGLAAALGTSPMPVREAIQRLVAANALVQSPDRVIRVAPFTERIYDQVSRIRMQLEGFAAERACFVRDSGLTARLTAHNQAMLAAARAHNVEECLIENQKLHFEIYEAAEYPELLEMISNLWLRAGPFVATAQQKPIDALRLFETGFQSHERLIAAIGGRDRKGARFALALDIRSATSWLRKNYNFAENAVRIAAAK